ncbi:MAG: extracellular solute-binding protein [Tabrizicola sp.]|uniref:extracellular solute-binding protein n=1 Tax=Tabrizicola sp. TaxID=2005166 RepID=UPI00273706FC|nr:extracellular solute-binding protein [Tabrizicola sp.]MDP3262852.1 extracellular solute-binding protein [Tabrizicola sp.]MDP3649049.1 extracellular solute-binding protein [Paracoccaceae bacterium]
MKDTTSAFSRRRFLQGSAAGMGILAAPAIISSKALASSGELNFTGWAGYPVLAEKVFPAFTAATGITVNFTEQPDQDTMLAQAKIALEAGGVDVIEPTIDRVGAWNSNGLLGAWDESKLAMGNYLPGLADGAAGERSRADGKLLYVPSNWGTEALVYNKESAVLGDPPSLGALFDPANQVVLRPHSALAAMGRWLDATGKLPRPWMDGYTDMAAMVELWDIALAEAVKAKGNVVQFWSGENEANAGFVANGATVGLCWDSTGFNLRNDGYGYMAPVEGAFAWHQGFVLVKNATNVDQAHEFAKWVSTAEGSALWATAFSSNPVGKGGAEGMDPAVAEYYNSAFDDAKLAALWWWPDQSAEFLAKRGEYADKYKAS